MFKNKEPVLLNWRKIGKYKDWEGTIKIFSKNKDHSIRKFAKIKDHIRTIGTKILGKYKDH